MATWAELDNFDEMDDATAALIIQLQLQDSQEIFEASQNKGKNVAGKLMDSQAAFQLSMEEMERQATIISDHMMARSITQAVRADAQLLAASMTQERHELNDRRLACHLGGVAPPPLAIEASPIDSDDRLLDVMSALFVEEPLEAYESDDDDTTELGSEYGSSAGESSRWALTRYNPRRRRLHCGMCQEDGRFFDVTPVPCGDTYCRACLQELFQSSFKDESLFPPRCCGQTFPPESIRLFLTAEIVEEYEKKKVEFEDPNRTYCSVPACSIYIRREDIHADCATCPECTSQTCSICKAEWHGNGDCPSDTGLQLVLATAAREGWQRCTSCRALVEHNLGCNHMTCRCGHQFCYECNVKWKTCNCPLFHEHRLLATAADRVAREPAVAGENMEERIAEARRTIIVQHQCDHGWTWTAGEGTCDECDMTHRWFTYVCDVCNRVHCADCRFRR